jgi:hypothetical protein
MVEPPFGLLLLLLLSPSKLSGPQSLEAGNGRKGAMKDMDAERQAKLTRAKALLIEARQCIEKGNHRKTILHMKWAMEMILPEGQQYCSQFLKDEDPDKTLQGFLDNILTAVAPAF